MSDYVEKRTSNGISLIPMDTILFSSRKIWIKGEINEQSANNFISDLLYLTMEDMETPIDVLVNSPGGEINSGMLMYDAIQGCPAPVRMFCMGKAYSMAAVLFVSGNHGRYMLPHSELMLHEPLLGNRVAGNSSSIQSISESLIETKNKLVEILSKHSGKTKEQIDKAISFDHYFGPEESIDFGLADETVSFDKLLETEIA